MVKSVNLRNADYIAEYGCGTGALTRRIISNAKKGAKILCFETNRELYCKLRDEIDDERVILINDGAENIGKHMKAHGIPHIDCAFAILSFSTMGKNLKNRIVKETKKALKPSGYFVFCRYVPHFEFELSEHFPTNWMKFVFLNLPPSLLYICRKENAI
jgi:phospholipid N-methyltransferase